MIEEHREIIDAIREGSEEMARDAMQRHLIRSYVRMRPGTSDAESPYGRRVADLIDER